MPVAIHATEKALFKVFSNDFAFAIPAYQRPYAWTREQASELLTDLLSFLRDGSEAVTNENPYFLGSIVLIKSEDSPESDVVDGQQRLLEMSGATDFIRDIYAGKIEVYDLSLVGAIADFCKAHASEFKSAFGFSNLEKVSAMQAVGVVLDWCGIKRKRKQTSVNGGRVEGYEVDKAHLEKVLGIVNRRGKTTAPPPIGIEVQGGAVAKTDDTFALWGTPECLQDIRESWALADSEEARSELRQIYPVEVLRRAIETCP